MQNKRILWVIGEQQAGKTTLTKFLAGYGALVLHIGEKIRQQKDPMLFATEENAYAAPSVESQVQEMILSGISEFISSKHETFIIDSAPKNTGQFKFVLEHSEMSTVIFITEDVTIRRHRAELKYNGDMSLFNAREPKEQVWLTTCLHLCNVSGIETLILNRKGK